MSGGPPSFSITNMPSRRSMAISESLIRSAVSLLAEASAQMDQIGIFMTSW
jgi:hypothetical protein